MQKTLLDIRYYDQTFHPDTFRGNGWRGRVVLILNWFRFWLETFIQFLVMRMGMDQVPAERREDVVSQFWKDVREERAASITHSPLNKDTSSLIPSSLPRNIRYKEGRGRRMVQEMETEEVKDTFPLRPLPLDGLVARMTAGTRTRRYGSSGRVVHEDNVGAVETEKETG